MSRLPEGGPPARRRYRVGDRGLHLRGAGLPLLGLRRGVPARGREPTDDSSRAAPRDLGADAQGAAQTLAEWARDGPADSEGYRTQSSSSGRRNGARLEGGEEDHHRAGPLTDTWSRSWFGNGFIAAVASVTVTAGARRYHRTNKSAKAAATTPIPRQPASSRNPARTMRKPITPPTKAKRCLAHRGSPDVRRISNIAANRTIAPSQSVMIGYTPSAGPPP